MVLSNKVKIYKNKDVEKVIAFIPPGHRHVRLYIEFNDQRIIIQQATVDAIIRAYSSVALHPQRKAIELVKKKLSKYERKEGFAEYQLIETSKKDEEIICELNKLVGIDYE
mgnify:CR=1 FL=1